MEGSAAAWAEAGVMVRDGAGVSSGETLVRARSASSGKPDKNLQKKHNSKF